MFAGVRAQRLDERTERELRIAHKRVVGIDVLADVCGVERGVDIGLAGGELDAKPRGPEAATDPEDDIGLLEEAEDWLRERAATRAEGEWMVLGEGALAFEARGHGGVEELGEFLQLRPRLGIVDALAGIDHGALGFREGAGDAVDFVGRGAVPRRRRWLVLDVAGKFLTEDVDRDFDDDGARTAVARLGESPGA